MPIPGEPSSRRSLLLGGVGTAALAAAGRGGVARAAAGGAATGTAARPVSTDWSQATGWASVRDFGAVGDGKHDDSAALGRAMRATLGKTLFFPNGTYRIAKDAPFSFGDSFSGTHWIFDNQAQLAYSGAGTMLTLTASQRGAVHNFVLDGLNVSSTRGGVIAAQGITWFTFRHVALFTPTGVTAFRIDSSNTGMVGIHVLQGGSTSDYATRGLVLGSGAVNAVRVFQDGAGQVAGYYFGITNGAGTNGNQDNRFEGLVFEGNQYDILCVNDQATTIRGCYFEASVTASVCVDNSGNNIPQGISVTDCFFVAGSNAPDVLDLYIAEYCGGLYMHRNTFNNPPRNIEIANPEKVHDIDLDAVPGAPSPWMHRNVRIRDHPEVVGPPVYQLESGAFYQNTTGRPISVGVPVYAALPGTPGRVSVDVVSPTDGPNGFNSVRGAGVNVCQKSIPGSASVTRPEFCTLSVQPMWWFSLTVEQAVLGYPSVVAEA